MNHDAASDKPIDSTSLSRSWWILFGGCALVYALTASRGTQWQDAGLYILRAVQGEVFSPLGLALSHPLHHWLARLVILPGLGEPSVVITLISGIAGAAAVANVFGCVATLTSSRGAALFAALSLAMAHTFWQMSTITEVYTLSAALLAGECWCLAKWSRDPNPRWLALLWLLNGLGVADHMQAALAAPIWAVVTLWAWRSRRIRFVHLLACAGLWCLGTLPYTALIVLEVVRSGEVVPVIRSALFGNQYAGHVLNTSLSMRTLVIVVAFPLYNFPNLLLPAAAVGLFRPKGVCLARFVRIALAAVLIVHVLFVLRYDVADQYTFFLPTYTLLSIFGGIGAASISATMREDRARRLQALAVVLLGATPLFYTVFVPVARMLDLLGSVAHNKPYRDDYTYIFTPWMIADHSAEQMAEQAVDLAGKDGYIIVEDAMGLYAVQYKALRHGLPIDHVIRADNEKAVSTVIGNWLQSRTQVVLVPLNADKPATDTGGIGRWSREGDLYVLEVAPAATRPGP